MVGMMTRQGMVGDNAKVAHGKAHVVDATKTALGEAAKTVGSPLDVNPAAGSATRVRVTVTLPIIDAPSREASGGGLPPPCRDPDAVARSRSELDRLLVFRVARASFRRHDPLHSPIGHARQA